MNFWQDYSRVGESGAQFVALEAALRIDFLSRVKFKKKDTVSRAFRELYKQQKMQVRLNEDILEVWKYCHPEFRPLVSQLRSALRYRHWLAHGRYWIPKLDRSYDYASVYDLASQTIADLPLMESR